jgi:hypothetical protein
MEINKHELVEIKSEAVRLFQDTEARYSLAKKALTAFKEHSSEKTVVNNTFHKISSKFEQSAKILISDTECKERVLRRIENKLDKLPLPNGINNQHKREIINQVAILGLESLMVKIKTFNLDQESKKLKKINEINASELADEIFNQVNELKRQVKANRQNHQEVAAVLSKGDSGSLSQAARLINPKGVNYNLNKEKEINDFLNGGDIIL